jgi:hypothetical protein
MLLSVVPIISDWLLGHFGGFALVRMDKMVDTNIWLWKEGTDPMSDWIYFSSSQINKVI